ncbi:MAG: carboxypeptidase regulatory-like domain-containing protein [Jatrophihabitans sp.]|uniref:carboxypeptidase regulatory-like domain-containing protein n=1 Tax=Jatrophihabitans sp. TaxID=1932789 RepID=UPI003F7E45E3
MTPPSSQPSLDELAAAPLDAVDAEVLARMAALYDALDPVPAGLVDRITFAITLDALHAEIAQLQHTDELAGVRSGDATEVQNVTFTSTHLTTMVTISPESAETVRIDGWIAPGAGVAVELRGSGQTLHTVADEDGRFVLDGVARGMVQLVLRPPAETGLSAVVTPSLEV